MRSNGVGKRMQLSASTLPVMTKRVWTTTLSGPSSTTQLPMRWARAGSGVTLLVKALALTLCRWLSVRQVASLPRVRDKRKRLVTPS